MARLKAKANSDCGTKNKISSLQALAALLWRCVTRARSVPYDEYTHCGFAFDNRGRLNPPLSRDYFGNAAQPGFTGCKALDLMQESVGWAALLLNELVASYNDEMVKGGAETWMRSRRILHATTKTSYNVMIAGSPRFDRNGVDFGVGKALAEIYGPGNRYDGQMIIVAGSEEGSIDVDACLSADCMSVLEMDEELIRAVFFVNRSLL